MLGLAFKSHDLSGAAAIPSAAAPVILKEWME
jgi:hypothetical protein